MAERETQAA